MHTNRGFGLGVKVGVSQHALHGSSCFKIAGEIIEIKAVSGQTMK